MSGAGIKDSGKEWVAWWLLTRRVDREQLWRKDNE
jgi:hypothetical protein